MVSPLHGTGAGKGGLLSGRKRLVLQYADFELIGPGDRLRFEPPELGLECRKVLDRAVDRREHDGGNAVQPREPAKRELAHPFGRGFAAAAPDCRLDRGNDFVEPLGLDRSLGRRPLEPPEELVAVERLAVPSALDDVHAHRFGALVARETLAAALALAAPADRVSGLAGVHDAVLA